MLKLALNLLSGPIWAKEYFLPSASVESADVLCTTMGGLQQMLAGNALLTKLVLVRASPDDTFYENTARAEFIERLEDRYGGVGFLDVQDPSLPVSSYSARRMTFKDFSDALQARSGMELDNARLPLNFLNLRDFLSLPEPPSARMSRFQLLQTLDARIESAIVPDASSAGKKIISRYLDVASCSRFLLFACRGAVSGFHVDLLTGTWVQAVSGRKAWPIITNLSDEERLEFQKHGHEWTPPSDKVRMLVLEPGDLLVMPPGCLTPHAPITIDDCLMHGGMFWDEKRVIDIVESINWIIRHPKVTNEPVPNQLPEILFELHRLIREKPHRFLRGDQTIEELLQKFEAAVRSMKGRQLGCSCRGKCTKSCTCKSSGFPCLMYWCHEGKECSNFLSAAASR